MDCNINHSVFLRSNGTLACWCDAGSLKTIQEFDPLIDYAHDVYLGKVYTYLRENLAAGVMPFPSYCSKCMVLQPSAPFISTHAQDLHMDTLQVEPSMACQLDCPGCIPMKDRKTRVARTSSGHLMLASKILEKILKDFQRAGIGIDTIDFQGHGEPLLNRDVWNMFRLSKSLFPKSKITTCTNANFDFREDMVEAGLDQILFAIDGMDQDSYAPYRIYGEFDQSYRFMSAFSTAARARGDKIHTVWKYVLFNHNDSHEQLLEAQKMALEAQVSELRFIITQLGPTSSTIVDENDIPRANNGVNVQVQNYKVDIKQLSDGMVAARENLEANHLQQASHNALFVAAMMKRLFSGPQIVPPKFQGFLNELTEIAEKLPTSSRTTINRDIEHLVNPRIATRQLPVIQNVEFVANA